MIKWGLAVLFAGFAAFLGYDALSSSGTNRWESGAFSVGCIGLAGWMLPIGELQLIGLGVAFVAGFLGAILRFVRVFGGRAA